MRRSLYGESILFRKGMFTPQSVLNAGLNADRMVANAFGRAIVETLGVMAGAFRTGSEPDQHWDGLYFTQ